MRGVITLAAVLVAIGCSRAPGPAPGADAAGVAPDASVGAPFACTTCDPASQFCYVTESGVLPVQPQCMDVPAACTATPTCACVLANIDPVCPGLGEHPACSAGQPISVICVIGI